MGMGLEGGMRIKGQRNRWATKRATAMSFCLRAANDRELVRRNSLRKSWMNRSEMKKVSRAPPVLLAD